MTIELPHFEDLQGVDAQQRAAAAEVIDLLYHFDSEVFSPGWEQRVAIMHGINARYGATDETGEMPGAVARMVCDVNNIEDQETQTRILEHVGSSGLGQVLYLLNNHNHDLIESGVTPIRLSAARGNPLDREILKLDPGFAQSLHMLGTEFRVDSIAKLLRLSAAGENNYLELIVGDPVDEVEEMLATDTDPQEELDKLIVAADQYGTMRHRQKLTPMEPERLVGVISSALQNIGVIE